MELIESLAACSDWLDQEELDVAALESDEVSPLNEEAFE